MAANEIILVDDEPDILELELEALHDAGFAATSFTDPLRAWERIQRGDISLVVTDWNMPGMTGLDLLFKTRGLSRPPHVIIVTAFGTVDRAVQAMNQGAFHFFEKPFEVPQFVALVKEAIERYQKTSIRFSDPAMAVKRPAPEPTRAVVASPNMQRTISMAIAAAASDSSVLLLGETGTGKEVVADHIHQHSSRARGPLVKVNCGALPEHLMESELFGHEKGAFTGADRRTIGRFEQASGGTLFLDEIGDLLLPLQVKLLRALQERTIERVGSSAPVPVDFRLICATHRDLSAAVAAKEFREDLYYRVNVVAIRVPPLRERPEDVVALSQHFFTTLRKVLPNPPRELGADALACLQAFHWPGNVRQLRNAVECALVLCRGPVITPDDLPEEVRRGAAPGFVVVPRVEVPAPAAAAVPTMPATPPPVISLRGSVAETEADLIRATLERHHWRITAAARELKIGRSTLYERMKLYNINRPEP